MSTAITEGSFVRWQPENLFGIFRMYRRVPVTGIVKRIDGKGALISCMGPRGKEEIPVLLSELTPAGVRNVAE